LRCVLTLISVNNIGNSTIWGIRETFVSLIAISAPAIKPLFTRKRVVGSTDDKNTESGPYRKFNHSKNPPTIGSLGTATRAAKQQVDLEANNVVKASASESDIELESISRNGSEEYIVRKNEGPLEVQVTTAVTLSTNENNPTSKLPAVSEVSTEGSKKVTIDPFRNGTAYVDEEWNRRGNTTQITVGHVHKI
jgi:hypothetical protein